jgi:hypothetical protein
MVFCPAVPSIDKGGHQGGESTGLFFSAAAIALRILDIRDKDPGTSFKAVSPGVNRFALVLVVCDAAGPEFTAGMENPSKKSNRCFHTGGLCITLAATRLIN